MRSVEEHRARALAPLVPLPAQQLSLLAAQGCVLARDVVALGPLPAFDVSAMDGYAVHASDVASATPGAPVTVPVVGDLPAGARRVEPLATGTAARIMTGAPVPPGADAIVPVEWTDGWSPPTGGEVAISRPPAPGQHVRRAGEGVAAGELLLRAGALVGPRQLSLLAATGRGEVLVHPRPRVAVVSTGNELVAPGTPAGFGQVSDANSTALTAAARAVGAQVTSTSAVTDDPATLLAVLREAAAGADVVITSGGVSAGAYDVVKEVLAQLDAEVGAVEFTKVAMQPGMPQGLGVLDGAALFTLPGNPVSAYLSFEVFVRPALARLAGLPDDHPDAHLPSLRAVAAASWSSPADKRQFTRAVLEAADPLPRVRPVGGPGSHLVGDLAVATVLALVPEGVGGVEVGDELTCLVLDAPAVTALLRPVSAVAAVVAAVATTGAPA